MATNPGWSRRAQYGMFFGFVAVIAGIVVGLILLGISLVSPLTFQRLRGTALDITAAIAEPLSEMTATVEGVFTGAGDYWDAAHQNKALKDERRKMLQRMIEAKAIQQENTQLKAALGLREETADAVAAGRIVGSSFSSPRRFAILSAGSSQGLEVGMPVRAASGLVGRVIDTAGNSSRVLLVSDKASIVPARLLRGGQPVIAQGRGDGTLDIRPLEVGRNPFKRGDIIVTSGTGGLYPPLVPVAKVVRLDDDGAVAIPLADPANISFAIVQRPFEPQAREVSAAADSAPNPE